MFYIIFSVCVGEREKGEGVLELTITIISIECMQMCRRERERCFYLQ